MDDNKTTIRYPSETASIKLASSKILDALKPYGASEDVLFDIRLCVEEAVRNAVVHGNLSDKNLLTTVTYWVKDGRAHIEIEDEGVGFDRRSLPDPTADANILRGSGRGVYLIEKLMDSAVFNETGNKITMIKKIK